jgi:precorrin isomerase/sirohydrochlorin ferrochelatase
MTHPIELESYRIVAERVDLVGWDPGPAAVAARIVHATADPGLLDSLVVSDGAVEAGVDALRLGAPIICDVEMVRSGIGGGTCLLGEVGPDSLPTRSAAAMALAAARHPEGAVVAVGCAPTALEEVNRRLAEDSFHPALVVGVPVGFVGASESKEELLRTASRMAIPVIVLRGERGGAAVAAAAINAIQRLARPPATQPASDPPPNSHPLPERDTRRQVEVEGSLMLIGHGTRSPAGQAELRRFADAVAAARPDVPVSEGFIEFMEPDLDLALDRAVALGSGHVVAVPLVLLGAGHLKDDGPAALARGRRRHPRSHLAYARDLGVHPAVLAAVAERIASCGDGADAVVVVGRGSSDPDANADLMKAARLLADGRGLGTGLGSTLGLVEGAFVSLTPPDITTTLDRCRRLGARRISVVPYFLFTGVLVERIGQQVRAWAERHPDSEVVVGQHIGIDDRRVDLVWQRFDEAQAGPVHMNCDGCLHRVAQVAEPAELAPPTRGG